MDVSKASIPTSFCLPPTFQRGNCSRSRLRRSRSCLMSAAANPGLRQESRILVGGCWSKIRRQCDDSRAPEEIGEVMGCYRVMSEVLDLECTMLSCRTFTRLESMVCGVGGIDLLYAFHPSNWDFPHSWERQASGDRS